MRRRISLLVAATTSAVVLAFVIPLCLLVQTMAADRAVATADQEARGVSLLVSSLAADPSLESAVESADARSRARTTVVMADGRILGPTTGSGPTPSELARARAGSAFTVSASDGTHIVVPVVTAGGTQVVHTFVAAADLRRGVVRAWFLIATLGVVLLGLALLVADQLGRRVSTPVIRVAGVADRLSEGDLAARARPEGPPETRALAGALNGLAERIGELLVAERSAVGDLSHRLRTPVTALRIDLDGVEDEELAERLRRHVGHLQRSIDAIVKDARRPVRHDLSAACDATAVVRAGVDFWSPLAEDQQRELATDLPDGAVPVGMDPVDLRDVLDILIDNVFAHTAEGTPFGVRLLAGTPHDPRPVLEVEDGPAGAADAPLDEHAGSGLGLQIARRALGHGGDLRLVPGDAGTQVRVHLPPPTEA